VLLIYEEMKASALQCVCVYDMVTTYELRAYCCLLRIIHMWTCEICVFPSTTLRLLFVTTKCHRWFWSKYQNVPPMFRLNSGLLENDRAERRESSSRIALIYIVFGPQWGLHANVNNNVCSPIGRTSANNRILSISQIGANSQGLKTSTTLDNYLSSITIMIQFILLSWINFICYVIILPH